MRTIIQLIVLLMLITQIGRSYCQASGDAEIVDVTAVSESANTTIDANNADEIDYMEQMIEAAVDGDFRRGREAQAARDEKIKTQNLEAVYAHIDFDTLYYTAKIITAEAGDVSEDIQRGVGEVFLNRIDSPEFPNTALDVLTQPGQYGPVRFKEFINLQPKMECVLIAKSLLEGNRIFPRSVVFQDNAPHGSGTHLKLWSGYSWMFYSYSNYPELYEEQEDLSDAG